MRIKDKRETPSLNEQIVESLNRGQDTTEFAKHCLVVGKYMQPLEGESKDIFEAVTWLNGKLPTELPNDYNFHTWKNDLIKTSNRKEPGFPRISLDEVIDCWYLIGRQIYRNVSEVMSLATELDAIKDPAIAKEAGIFFGKSFKYGDPGENDNYLSQLKSAYEIAGDLVATRKYDEEEIEAMRKQKVSLTAKIIHWEYFRLDTSKIKPGELSKIFKKMETFV